MTRSKRTAAPAPDDPVTAYAKAVTGGAILTGRAVRLACERHLRDLTALPGYTFSPVLAQHALGFFPKFLRLAEGEHAGQPFVLQPWQQFVVGSLFGWLGPDGFRRFRTAYIEVGKGNGKSPMAAGIGLYGMLFDEEPAAQVFAAAVTRDQAGILFEDARKMVSASPELSARLEVLQNNIAHLDSGSFFRPVSSEARSLDGKRVHMALIDEIHEHPSSLVVDKMRAGTKGRRQALIVEITNSGYDRLSVCFQHHSVSLKVLERTVDNEAWFAYVCQLDSCPGCLDSGKTAPVEGCTACDDWRDERVWPKANPNLGVSITRKYLREIVDDALGLPSKQNIVRRLNFCEWTESITAWLPIEAWAACSADVPDAERIGRPCYGGLDLGQSDDFCAFVRLYLLSDERLAVRCSFWLPESALSAYRSRPYDEWRRAGLLTVTEGNTTDYGRVEKDVAELCRASGVIQVGYDKRFAEQMAQNLLGQDIAMVDTPQGFYFNEALRKLEALVKAGLIAHGGHAILRWMISNAVVRMGPDRQMRLDKEHAGDKIDGVAALAMATDRWIRQPEMTSVYESRGVLVLG